MTESSRRQIILLPIDLYGIEPVTLEALVGIARQLDRGLLGLFLEDHRLRQVADLPFSTEIVLGSGRERGLLRQELARRYSRVAEETRRRLGDLARRHRVELSFQSATGSRWHGALLPDRQLDVFFAPRRHGGRQPPGPLFRPALGRLGLVLTGGEEDGRTLGVANALLSSGLAGEIYLLSATPPNEDQLQALDRPGARVCVQSNFSLDPGSIASLIRQSNYQLLLLPRSCLGDAPPAALATALDNAWGQVMIIH